MRIASIVSLNLLFLSLSMAAQSSGSYGTQTIWVNPAPPLPACPIDVKVRQGWGQTLRSVGKDDPRLELAAARLRLLVNDTRLPKPAIRIVRATVTVHGLDGRSRLVPLQAKPEGGSGEISKTLTVPMNAQDTPGVSGEMVLPGFSTARMVDLDSVTFDDGETWTLSGRAACRVAPDPLMLVAGR